MPAPPQHRSTAPRAPAMLVKDAGKIRRARKVKKFSQQQLGALCGRSRTAVANLERGITLVVDEDVALAVAHWLDLPLEDVFTAPSALVVPSDETRVSSTVGGGR